MPFFGGVNLRRQGSGEESGAYRSLGWVLAGSGLRDIALLKKDVSKSSKHLRRCVAGGTPDRTSPQPPGSTSATATQQTGRAYTQTRAAMKDWRAFAGARRESRPRVRSLPLRGRSDPPSADVLHRQHRASARRASPCAYLW